MVMDRPLAVLALAAGLLWWRKPCRSQSISTALSGPWAPGAGCNPPCRARPARPPDAGEAREQAREAGGVECLDVVGRILGHQLCQPLVRPPHLRLRVHHVGQARAAWVAWGKSHERRPRARHELEAVMPRSTADSSAAIFPSHPPAPSQHPSRHLTTSRVPTFPAGALPQQRPHAPRPTRHASRFTPPTCRSCLPASPPPSASRPSAPRPGSRSDQTTTASAARARREAQAACALVGQGGSSPGDCRIFVSPCALVSRCDQALGCEPLVWVGPPRLRVPRSFAHLCQRGGVKAVGVALQERHRLLRLARRCAREAQRVSLPSARGAAKPRHSRRRARAAGPAAQHARRGPPTPGADAHATTTPQPRMLSRAVDQTAEWF